MIGLPGAEDEPATLPRVEEEYDLAANRETGGRFMGQVVLLGDSIFDNARYVPVADLHVARKLGVEIAAAGGCAEPEDQLGS